MTKHIFLIGFMGAGKTTLGKKLANSIQIPFVDSDAHIEKDAQMSISSIFETKGEKHFRKLENNLLKKLNSFSPSVISVGGGFPCFNNNMELMKEMGWVIYLERSPKELTHRLFNAKSNKRPLLASFKTEEEFLQFVTTRLSERESIYKEATITLNRDEQTVEKIKQAIENYDKNAFGSGE
jgi:shikimate kinase